VDFVNFARNVAKFQEILILQILLLGRPRSTQPYNLRPRRHSFSLTQKQSSYDDCNFITRKLFYDIY